jgi:putative ABC transport system permease protein
VLLVNQALVRREFAGQSPVGQVVYIGRDPNPCEIVGVVEDVRQFGLDLAATPQFFGDLRQWSGNPLFPVGAYYAVRVIDNPRNIIPLLRAIVRELDPQAVLFNVAPMTDVVANTVARPRLYAVLFGIFATTGVVLAVIGIYGVLAFTVTQRTNEIGIRMALGARPMEVMALVLRQSLAVTTAGILIGVGCAAGVTRFLEGMLFGLTPLDARTFVGVSLLFALVAALASSVPACRATRVDPVVALRRE